MKVTKSAFWRKLIKKKNQLIDTIFGAMMAVLSILRLSKHEKNVKRNSHQDTIQWNSKPKFPQ